MSNAMKLKILRLIKVKIPLFSNFPLFSVHLVQVEFYCFSQTGYSLFDLEILCQSM